MARARHASAEGGPTRWQSTPYVKSPSKRLRPVHDPLAARQNQDHRGHGCTWDPLTKGKFTPRADSPLAKAEARDRMRNATATGRVVNPKTGRMHRPEAGGSSGNTRTCTRCGAVVKGNGWHLNQHIRRHK